MSYLCAGLFAEGSTDYEFLLPLLDQMIPALAHALLPGVAEIGDSVGIDAPRGVPPRRDARIAAAISAYWDQCTLFVIHADGGGDPARALAEQVAPGLGLARAARGDVPAAACVPVREIEAWLLADEAALRALLRSEEPLGVPTDPEAVLDPKRALRDALSAGGGRTFRGSEPYAFLGANVDVTRLRRLPAFCRFEEQLAEAILAAARAT
ncbi:DUF4276 family protein [Sorangium sp. So ce1335]|uniref:DUF4276 family protein n=1 Tax=Sorangium sp. So ce1335 TaxID=3133335 RepID=UPI003F5E84E3